MRIAVLFAVLLGSGIAQADRDPVSWRAPKPCPSSDEVRDRIARRLGDDRAAITASYQVEVLVTRDPHGFTAQIRSLVGHERSLAAPRCDDLADAVAVVIARLATDARAEGDTRLREHAPAVIATQRDVREAPPPSPAHERWNGGVRALALTGIGMTPHVGVGGDLAGFVQRGNKFVEVGYAKWVERPLQLFPDGGIELGTQLFAVRGGWASTRMPLRAWGGLETGVMHGVGALLDRHQPNGRWIALAAGFGVGWPMSPRTRLVGTFEVAAALDRATFTFMDGTQISEPAPLSARSALGLEVAFR